MGNVVGRGAGADEMKSAWRVRIKVGNEMVPQEAGDLMFY